MFVAIKDLLADCGELTLILRPCGDKMKVIVCPPSAGQGKNIELALAKPLPLVATPEELDEGFAAAVAAFRTTRKSLTEQVEATTTILGAAEKEQAKKATRSTAKAAPAAAPKCDVPLDRSKSSDDDEMESDESGNAEVSIPASNAAPTQPATANDDLASLLG